MTEEEIKGEAMRQFALRKDHSQMLLRISAESADPDAAKAVHCQYCETPTELVVAQPVFPVSTVCSQCRQLEERGWIEQAVNFHEGM